MKTDPAEGHIPESGENQVPMARVVVSAQARATEAGPDRERPRRSAAPPASAWLFLEVLRERWLLVVLGGLCCAGLGFAAALRYWKPGFLASSRLIRHESPQTSDVFTYQTLTPQTYVSLLRSPELMAEVAKRADPPLSVDVFVKRVRLTPERDGDIVLVETFGPTKEAAVALANLYVEQSVRFTQQLQAGAAEEVRQFVGPQLTQLESEIARLKQERPTLSEPLPSALPARPSPLMVKLQKAREEVVDALTRYTETHPEVQAARARVASIQEQIDKNQQLPALPSEAELASRAAILRDAWEMLRSELQPLETTRHELISRQRAAELVSHNPPGYYRILSPALPREVKGTNREIKIASVTTFFGLAGVLGFALLALVGEVLDNRLKRPADVSRVTGLPVIACAPRLDQLSATEQRNWAFRTWIHLQGHLSENLNHGLVCGVTSAAPGEGRSTWVRHLAHAASASGFRVLTVSAGEQPQRAPEPATPHRANGNGVPVISHLNALPTPLEVEDKLVGLGSEPVVHIPLPGWVWNIDRRKQWASALQQWRKIENVVILVELPPASVPETILLAEEIPDLIWLADSGSSTASETREQLETLRSAHCNLVAAVLNRAPVEYLRSRWARWLPALILVLSWNVGHAQLEPALTPTAAETPTPIPAAAPAQAQTPAPPPPAAAVPPPATNPPPETAPSAPTAPVEPVAPAESTPTNAPARFLGGSAPTQRAPWQERFTLGPGDVLRIALYGAPEYTRANVIVDPDGHVAFMEAQGVLAAGRTIDEFRAALDEALSGYRRAARTMVTPVAFHSKKYCVLGKVNQRGVYVLEHPITVLEAIARAKGFEVGLRERDSIDLVDLQRSFLMREGKRVPVSFERMFLDGDLSQNVSLAPGDYLFFPSTSLKEVHVIGDVRYPGTLTWTPTLGVIGAISQRAGFNEKSYKSRVLVVRGSLESPQTYVVDCNAILTGERPDFPLQPKDIVYVSKRPWWRAEELVDLAITAFLQSIVSSYVGQDIVQPFNP